MFIVWIWLVSIQCVSCIYMCIGWPDLPASNQNNIIMCYANCHFGYQSLISVTKTPVPWHIKTKSIWCFNWAQQLAWGRRCKQTLCIWKYVRRFRGSSVSRVYGTRICASYFGDYVAALWIRKSEICYFIAEKPDFEYLLMICTNPIDNASLWVSALNGAASNQANFEIMVESSQT